MHDAQRPTTTTSDPKRTDTGVPSQKQGDAAKVESKQVESKQVESKHVERTQQLEKVKTKPTSKTTQVPLRTPPVEEISASPSVVATAASGVPEAVNTTILAQMALDNSDVQERVSSVCELEEVALPITRVDSTDAAWEHDDATNTCRMYVLATTLQSIFIYV